MLYDILEEGVQQGVFEIDDMSRTAVIITHAIHGLDVPYIRDNLADQGIDKDMLSNYIATILLNGIKRST